VAEGILAGGGTALLIASKRLETVSKDRTLPADIRTGVNIVKNAIKLPCKTIAANAGVEGSVVVDEGDDLTRGVREPQVPRGREVELGARDFEVVVVVDDVVVATCRSR
jgi:hypothetical protein